MEDRQIIIFDGVCHLCQKSVKFIIKRDPKKIFFFTPLQGDLAKELMGEYKNGQIELDTFLLIKNKRCYERSDAALEILKGLNGLWFLLRAFKILPKPIRDYLYGVVSQNRYSFFGRSESCLIPTLGIRDRFIG